MGNVIKSNKFAVRRVTRELLEYADKNPTATVAPRHLSCPKCSCETFFVKSEVCVDDDHANILCSSCGIECSPWAEQIP